MFRSSLGESNNMFRKSLVAIVLFCCFITGCSDGQIPVRGTVTLDGTPIESGNIMFEPVDLRGPTGGGLITNGSFSFKTFPGEKTVRIRGERATGEFQVIEEEPDARIPIRITITDSDTHWDNSTLRVSVVSGMQPLTFALESSQQ